MCVCVLSAIVHIFYYCICSRAATCSSLLVSRSGVLRRLRSDRLCAGVGDLARVRLSVFHGLWTNTAASIELKQRGKKRNSYNVSCVKAITVDKYLLKDHYTKQRTNFDLHCICVLSAVRCCAWLRAARVASNRSRSRHSVKLQPSRSSSTSQTWWRCMSGIFFTLTLCAFVDCDQQQKNKQQKTKNSVIVKLNFLKPHIGVHDRWRITKIALPQWFCKNIKHTFLIIF